MLIAVLGLQLVVGVPPDVALPIPDRDGAWIDDHVDEHRVVLVGEEVHGVAEHIELKIELAQRLIEQHGFTHVAIEDDVYKAAALNDALKAGTPAADGLAGFYWCWHVEELASGLDALDATIIGFDVQSPRWAIESLERRASTEAQEDALATVKAMFEGGRSAYAARSMEQMVQDGGSLAALDLAFDLAPEAEHLRRVREVWANAAEHGPRMKVRDRGMAESVLDVLESDPDARIVVFAHNAHAGYEPFYTSFTGGVTPLGAHLRDAGVSTLSIGAVYCTGSVLLDPRQRNEEGMIETVETPPADSQAGQWAAIPHERWVINLADVADDPFFTTPPAGHFNNYGPARSLAGSYDLLVGYRTVRAATPIGDF